MIIENTIEEYHSSDGISSTGLKLIAKSPFHYWAEKINPDRPEPKDKKAFVIGNAFHAMFLEPNEFKNRYIVKPEGLDGRTKEGKEFNETAKSSGKILLTSEEHRDIWTMSNMLNQHPLIQELLDLEGVHETSIYWDDCKTRPDRLIYPCEKYPNGLILDLKSTIDASRQKFTSDAFKYGYHLSAAHYCNGVMAEYKLDESPIFVFAAVEKHYPYAVKLYHADHDLMSAGQIECAHLLSVYRECVKTDHWPAYGDDLEPLGIPAWAMKDYFEEEIEIGYAD